MRAQRGEVTYLRSYSRQVAELGFEPHLSSSTSWMETAGVSL